MKKFLTLALSLALTLSLAACGSSGSTEPSGSAPASGEEAETVTLKIAASPTPHAEILEQVKPILAKQGIDLVITTYSDYPIQNTVVDEGEEDANYFQHTPYLEQFNAENGTDLVSAGKIHYEPMGIYPGKTATLEDLPDGATIAVPNDATNEARALQLLAAQGLIEIDPEAGLNATPKDITSNPKNLQIKELEAAMIPNTLEEYDLNVINSNYALQGGLNPAEDALVSEDTNSDSAQTYANIVAVKAGHENDPAIVALVEALHSEEIQNFINETYSGSVVPIAYQPSNKRKKSGAALQLRSFFSLLHVPEEEGAHAADAQVDSQHGADLLHQKITLRQPGVEHLAHGLRRRRIVGVGDADGLAGAVFGPLRHQIRHRLHGLPGAPDLADDLHLPVVHIQHRLDVQEIGREAHGPGDPAAPDHPVQVRDDEHMLHLGDQELAALHQLLQLHAPLGAPDRLHGDESRGKGAALGIQHPDLPLRIALLQLPARQKDVLAGTGHLGGEHEAHQIVPTPDQLLQSGVGLSQIHLSCGGHNAPAHEPIDLLGGDVHPVPVGLSLRRHMQR